MVFSPSPKSKNSPLSILTYLLLLFPFVTLTFYLPDNATTIIFSRKTSAVSLKCNGATKPLQVPEFRLLIAVVTMPELYERRHLLRTIFSLQTYNKSIAEVDIRYVFCNLTSEEQRVLVALEILQYDDIIILNCEETMSSSKTYALISTLPTLYDDNPYDFVMKADDDSYVILDKLVESLRNKSREDMYYGLKIPCDKEGGYPYEPFMEGMGYVLSWDLVEWIAASDSARKDKIGPEDMWLGMWFNLAGIATNRYDMNPRIYDYKGNADTNCFRHDFIPDSILVHRLKLKFEWVETLKYFDIPSRVKPSKLYNIS